MSEKITERGISIPWYSEFKSKIVNKKDIPFDIVQDDLSDIMDAQNEKCYYTGYLITYPRLATPLKSDFKVSLIDSDLGYVIGNIRLVCKEVSLIKQNMSEAVFLDTCRAVVEERGN